ncbi:unnamed protein product [Rotaria socialis]|uniref:IPT/TIG domain-containing protein n=3 Tax=Rotaria socialis TaxID=392032 RepID=A0A818I206_9BILA|nr:unnamed protein product [Rotaria socialis]
MIWIYGSRFAQNGFNSVPSVTNSNIVKLVDGYSVYDCEMHNDKTTNTQLTCYAPALPESVYQIRVYVNGQLQDDWANNSLCNGTRPSSASVQEPGNQTTVTLGVISTLVLVIPSAKCRSQSRCDTQPVLKSYDVSGNVIQKLDSDDQP